MTTSMLTRLPDSIVDAEFFRIVDELTRRGFLTGGLATAAALGLAGCGADDDTHPSASTGSWTWTDATGKRIHLTGTPRRLVVTGGLLESLWDFGLRPVGCLGMKPAAGDTTAFPRIPRADLAKITFCGGGDGVDAEKVVALRPDLVLAEWDAPSKTYWGFGDAQSTATTIEKVCPVGGVDITGAAPELLGHMRELAVSLGVAPSGKTVAAVLASFEDAAAALRKAVSAKPGLRVALMSADTTGVSLGNPKGMTDLAYDRSLGMHLVTGPQRDDKAAATSNYWSDTISWENIGDYKIDLLLLTANAPVAQLEGIATYRRLPAVVAKQTVSYQQLPAPSYLTYAARLRTVAAAIESARLVA